jgi:hypothetical protein
MCYFATAAENHKKIDCNGKGRDITILVNKINKYIKLASSLLTFAFIARFEFETRVRIFFLET